MSTFLSNRALKAIERIGDLLLPRTGDFPSFSETGSIEHIDDLLAHAPAGDVSDLNTALVALSFMPTFVLKWLIRKMEESHNNESGGMSSLLRQLNLGLRGLIFSCYYSGKTGSHFTGQNPVDLIGFNVNRIPD